MSNLLHLEGKLERIDPSTPWGFRMQGGKDFGSPLTIQKVTGGSLADKCGLREGDIIVRIGTVTADQLKHKDAQDSIKASGNKLDLLLQRGGSTPRYDTFNAPTVNVPRQQQQQQQQQQPPISYTSATNYNAAPKPFAAAPATKAFSPVSNRGPGSGGDNPDNVKNMKNLNISQPAASGASFNKFAALDDRTALAAGERNDVGKKSAIIEPIAKTAVNSTLKSFNSPSSLYSSTNRNENASIPAQSVKHDNAKGDKKSYVPSETYRLVHESDSKDGPDSSSDTAKYSGTLRKLQQQMDSEAGIDQKSPQQGADQFRPGVGANQMKPGVGADQKRTGPVAPPWESAKSPSSVPSAKPWQPSSVGSTAASAASSSRPVWAPSKPSGVGMQIGRQGDAMMRDAGSAMGDGRIPMCTSCKVAIRGPFVLAMGKSWCPDHFVCANPHCGNKLLDIGFVEEGGALYCEKDYEKYFAPHCRKCQAAIVGTCVNALQTTWHPECFTCTHCNQPIGGGSFHLEDGKPYCDADWNLIFQTKCTSCDFPIEPGDRMVEAMSKNWHAECFNCSMCQANLEGQPFFPKGGKPYCKKHAR